MISSCDGNLKKQSAVSRFSYRLAKLAILFACCGLLNAAAPRTIRSDAPPGSAQGMIASKGQAAALIAVGDNAGSSDRFVAAELQRYIEMLSGAKLEIVSSRELSRQAKGKSLLLVGSPESNELVRQAANHRQVNFQGLKPEGYILRRLSLEGRPALVVGGNDAAGTMYAAYDLLERLGFVFLLTKDILPQKRVEVALPSLDERVEPAFRRRGVHVDNCYPNQTLWSLDDWRKIIDQMAKMRMNYLQVFWFPNTPWLSYEYRGEKNFLGDASVKESGYMLWRSQQGSFLAKDVTIGREHFKYPRIAPPELQDVETPEQAFQKAQDLLRAVIAYAKTHQIKTWLAIDPVSMPPNLARFARNRSGDLPFQPVLGGAYMCPADPVAHEINEGRLKSLFETYPEAEGYFLWFPELYPTCDDEKSRAYTLQERPKFFAEETLHWQAYANGYERNADRVVDSDVGTVELMRSALEARDRINPKAKLGIGAFGRGFVYPLIDKLFAKDVPFTDMISRAIWTPMGVPMGDYGGMGERERTLITRSDCDSHMLGMQFNVNMYYKDRTFEGALENGVAGHTTQVNRARGMEQNDKFMAEGAWKPHLKPNEFYQDYVRRIFGEAAAPEALKAYQLLEENEEYLSWTGRSNFPCCGVPYEIGIIQSYSEQGNPYDGPTFAGWAGFLDHARDESLYYAHSAALLRQALAHLERAEKQVSPGSRSELAYLRNKTEAYAMHLDTMVQLEKAYLEFDAAFRVRGTGSEFMQRLDHSLEMFREAQRMATAMATKFAEVIDDPSDLGVLYRINVYMIDGTDIVVQFMQNIDNFHHGKPYLNPVPLEKVFAPLPRFQHGKL
ncbi:MAG: alpha-glucuronidase family glycosyl hydrolase [Terriglobia bacterium]